MSDMQYRFVDIARTPEYTTMGEGIEESEVKDYFWEMEEE